MQSLQSVRRHRFAARLGVCLLGALSIAAMAAPPSPNGVVTDHLAPVGATSKSVVADAVGPKEALGDLYALGAWRVTSGGANVSGGGYTGTVSIGQVELPTTTVARAGPFELTAGWLVRVVPRADAVFRNGFEP